MAWTVIKVKIGLRPNGDADHPDWTILPLAAAGADRAAKEAIILTHSFGSWHYDKQAGHQVAASGRAVGAEWDSPFGMQWGCRIVSEQFAAEAVTAFSALVTRITEARFQQFYNQCSCAHVSPEDRDADELLALKAEYDLRVATARPTIGILAEIAEALDPDHPRRGVKRNHHARWATHKARLGMVLVDP